MSRLEWNGRKIILDNLREELSAYTVDIQDVVRSAILDGIELGSYVEECREDPWRLEQIRLLIKEDLKEEVGTDLSGAMLYKIRCLHREGHNIEGLKKLLASGMEDEYAEIALDWHSKGYELKGLKISWIPRHLLDIFEKGLMAKMDMREFNTGVAYDKEYLLALMRLQSDGKSCKLFVDGTWDLKVLQLIEAKAGNLRPNEWAELEKRLRKDMDLQQVSELINCCKQGMGLAWIGENEVYTAKHLGYIRKAFEKKLDWKKLVGAGKSLTEVEEAYNSMLTEKGRVLSGRLHKF